MTPLQITGNILSGIALFLFFISSLLKHKNKILFFQIGNHIFGCAGEACLGQWSGCVQDIICIIRNLCIIFKKCNKTLSIIFILLGLSIGVLANIFLSGNDPWGYLPIFASFEFSVIVLIPNVKTPMIKLAMCISTVCWGTYGFVCKNYMMMAGNIITFISSLGSIIVYFYRKKDLNENV